MARLQAQFFIKPHYFESSGLQKCIDLELIAMSWSNLQCLGTVINNRNSSELINIMKRFSSFNNLNLRVEFVECFKSGLCYF